MDFLVIIIPFVVLLLAMRVFLKTIRWLASACAVLGLVLAVTSAVLLVQSDSKDEKKKATAAVARHAFTLKVGSGIALGSIALVVFIFRLNLAQRPTIRDKESHFVRIVPFRKANQDSERLLRLDLKNGKNGELVLRLEGRLPGGKEQSAMLRVEFEASKRMSAHQQAVLR